MYALQFGLDKETKMHFFNSLDELVDKIPPTNKILIDGDLNGLIEKK